MPAKPDKVPHEGGGRRLTRRPPDPDVLYRQQVADMREYLDDARVDAATQELRANRGLRRRKDGTPSSRPPQATVPVKYWATVYDEPVVQYSSLAQRLERYRDRLRYLRSRGLYDGPTELTFEDNGDGDK